MRKLFLTIFTVAATLVTATADYNADYYSRMDGKSKEELKKAVKQCIKNHTRLEYYELPNYWQYTDVYPDLVNGQKRWWEMYSDNSYLIKPGHSGKQSFSSHKMQREHAVPKSWWKQNGDVEYTDAYTDMWNLYPSDGDANQAKYNYAFGEVRTASYDNGVTKVGTPKAGYGGGSQYVFEPGDDYKGDFARAIFYMATVYDDINWVYHYMFNKNEYPTLVEWSYKMLLQWAREDKVSQKEINRNDLVEQYQGNRNPFIDFPELAEYIWGQRTNEVFYIADQEDIDPSVPITGDPEINSPANGDIIDFGQIAVGYSKSNTLQIIGKNMTSPLSARVVGTNRDFFIPEVTSIPASTINKNGGYLLSIKYQPDAIGKHEAKLTLYDGGINGSIVVNLSGEALEAPQLKALHALEPTNVTADSYTANWEAPAGTADYYVLSRVRYADGNEDIETYETSETSYTITERDPSVAESYTVTYYHLGIESPISNSVYVASTGINDIRTEAPCHIYGIEGGILVNRSEGEAGDIRVYSLCGEQLIEVTNASDGMLIALPQGVYIATINNATPTKLIVK